MHSLSAIIVCMNEQDRIQPCLESLKQIADEIIVVDSGSTDDTIAIVRKYTDKVWITADWPGDGFQKQRALDKATGGSSMPTSG
jgi:glycosyltransferase involved in cell wall biosynthesis